MKTTFLNRKDAQIRAGLVTKQEAASNFNKIKLTNSAFGVSAGSLNEKKI